MKKEKMAWGASLMLIALLAMQLPGSIPARDEDYAFVRTLVDIHRQVSARYVEDVDPDKLREGAIAGMLNQLDPYTDYVPPTEQKAFDQMLEGQFEGVGIQLSQKENGDIEVVTPIDDSPAFKAGVMAGDIVVKVNGQSVTDKRLPDVTKMIQGKIGSEVKMTVRRGSKELELTMSRQQIIMPTVKGFNRNRDNGWNYWVDDQEKIAYLRITQFTGDTYDKLRPVVESLLSQGMRGLIMDLRDNPGGWVDDAVAIADIFLPEVTVYYTENRKGEREYATAQPGQLNIPLVVLMNENSASASEVLAGALQDNGVATIVGVTSYGKGIIQYVMPIGDKGAGMQLTVAQYFTPKGHKVHKTGITPDVVAELPEGDTGMYETGDMKDPQLSKAVEVLKEKMQGSSI
jgi:carboxyl-terminal processing protease